MSGDAAALAGTVLAEAEGHRHLHYQYHFRHYKYPSPGISSARPGIMSTRPGIMRTRPGIIGTRPALLVPSLGIIRTRCSRGTAALARGKPVNRASMRRVQRAAHK
jgi:hypothetical protein